MANAADFSTTLAMLPIRTHLASGDGVYSENRLNRKSNRKALPPHLRLGPALELARNCVKTSPPMDPVRAATDTPRTVVVLGLARSGTSVVTAMLEILGVEMGPSIEDESNPRGSREDIDFARLHKDIFDATGSERKYWNPPARDEILALRSQFDGTVRELLRKKATGKALWGWKHSRTLLTYDLFLPYLINPHFILVFRNPLGVALSSVEHTRKYQQPVDFSQALKLAHFYQAEMLRFLENQPEIPKLLVSYEDVLVDPSKEAAKMARFLGIALSDEKARAVAELVLPRDRLQAEKGKMRSFWRGKLPRLIHKLSQKVRDQQRV